MKEGSNAWWPLEGSNVWWPMEGKRRSTFSPILTSPQEILLKPSFFFYLKVLLYHGFRPLLTHFLPFP